MKERKTIIVSAFPGCGKSFATQNFSEKFKMTDSDSSSFSWVNLIDGKRMRNPEFPANYIEHIKDCIGQYDIIFVSSHDTVRDALEEAGLFYFLIYPDPNLIDVWMKRFVDRGNDNDFVTFISDNWDNFITAIEDRYEKDSGHKFENIMLTKSLPFITDKLLKSLMNGGASA